MSGTQPTLLIVDDERLNINVLAELFQETYEILVAKNGEQTLQAARLRDDVERMTCHDLKPPLNAAINVPELLMEALQLNDEQKEMLEMVRQAGYGMLDIVNNSLNLYRMEQGVYETAPTDVDLAPLVERLLAETRPLTGQMGVSMDLEMEAARESSGFIVRGETLLCYAI